MIATEKRQVVVPSVFAPLYEDQESDIYLITGGRYSAKTHNLKQYLAISVIGPTYFRAICTRYNFGSIRDSIKSAVEETIDQFRWRKLLDVQRDRIVNPANGNCIVFKGLKKSELQQQKGKAYQGFNVLVVEEAQEWSSELELFDWYRSFRCEHVHHRAILVLNPTHRGHWIHKRFYERLRVPDGYNGIDYSELHVRYIHSSYRECISHLPANIIREMEVLRETDPKSYENIVEGGWFSDDEKALFRWEWLERNRITHADVPQLREVVVVMDPAADGSEEHHDKHGILVVGEDYDANLYVLSDNTDNFSVEDAAQAVVRTAAKARTSTVIVEKNNGGKWIGAVIHQVNPTLEVYEVTATDGKVARMRPCAAYCQRDKVKFVGSFPDLEHQLCTYAGKSGQRSPNNYDCLAWAYHYFSQRYASEVIQPSASGLV